MSTIVSAASLPSAVREDTFFAPYAWCLDPRLTVVELFSRLREELERAEDLTRPWQREESLGNVYLFACAIACTIDDDLARRSLSLAPAARALPRFRSALDAGDRVLVVLRAIRSIVLDGEVTGFARRWARCVDEVCRELAARLSPDPGSKRGGRPLSRLRRAIEPYLSPDLPESALHRRMKLPEAFRCQDLAPADVVTLARRYLSAHGPGPRGTAVVGIRTAGAYFAPLVAAVLESATGLPVPWLTVRPKQGTSWPERRRLFRIARSGARVALVDDHPYTGATLRLAVAILRSSGIADDRIVALVPRHPADPAWTLDGGDGEVGQVRLVTLDPEEREVMRRLEPQAMEPILAEMIDGGRDVRIVRDPPTEAIDGGLSAHFRDGFHVRTKRAYALLPGVSTDAGAAPVRVIAKSVGYGWLGYHAYFAASRLPEFVPRLLGLRHGIMVSEWAGGPERAPLGDAGAVPVGTLASYVAARAVRLGVPEDPGVAGGHGRWSGWDEIVGILRRLYGPFVGRLAAPALRRRLKDCTAQRPALIDGRMRPEEWLPGERGVIKLDFEHHNFGGAELDVVDPALDLASAIQEFGLDERGARELVARYARESGDGTIGSRLLLYELLHGIVTMERARGDLAANRPSCDPAEIHLRLQAARDALTYRLARFCGALLAVTDPPSWSGPLFLLDLDGVFDREDLGFPHTTVDGLAALDRLRANGYAVVLSTGRGIEDVRRYCRAYGLPGGLAEYGSVFFDAVRGAESRVGPAAARAELSRLRRALARLPGVFQDARYRYSARAFRYVGGRPVPLDKSEVDDCLRAAGCEQIDLLQTAAASHLLPRGTGKGPGVGAIRRLTGKTEGPLAAIGDSDDDHAMLAAADEAYAPANASRLVRELAGQGRVRVMRHILQRGLLEAVRDLSRRHGLPADGIPPRPSPERGAGDLMVDLLTIADWSLPRRILATFDLQTR